MPVYSTRSQPISAFLCLPQSFGDGNNAETGLNYEQRQYVDRETPPTNSWAQNKMKRTPWGCGHEPQSTRHAPHTPYIPTLLRIHTYTNRYAYLLRKQQRM